MSPNFQTQAGIISYPSSRGKQSTDLRGKPITYYFLSLSWKTRTKTMKKMKHWRGSFLYQWLKPFGFWSLPGREAWRWSFLSSSFYCLSTLFLLIHCKVSQTWVCFLQLLSTTRSSTVSLLLLNLNHHWIPIPVFESVKDCQVSASFFFKEDEFTTRKLPEEKKKRQQQ